MSLDHWPPPLAIAHRGSRELWPENTMVAFSGAVALGLRYIETDLHVTADGTVVCIHDHTLDRTTNGAGRVFDHDFADLSSLDAGFRHRSGGDHPFRDLGIRVPAFEELVTSFPEVSFVVDLKVDGLVAPLAEVIEVHRLEDRLIAGSFSDGRLAEFRVVTGGRVPTSTGPILTRIWLLASRIGRPGGGEASALQLPGQVRGARLIDRKLVDTAHASGLQVHVWTVNDPGDMESFLDRGVDGIVTDRPDLLQEVLAGRA